MNDSEFKLPDGRTLAYRDSGGDGYPIIWAHSAPGSRKQIHPLPPQPGIDPRRYRLICFDRSGYGSSTKMANRSFEDSAHDLRNLLAKLYISKCSVVGHSTVGCAYAMAYAHYLPKSVESLLMFSPMSPWFRGALRGMHYSYSLWFCFSQSFTLEWSLNGQARRFRQNAEKQMKKMSKQLPKNESIDFESENTRLFLEAVVDGYRQGGAGQAADVKSVYRKKWPFRVQDIQQPTMIYNGAMDKVCPPQMAEYLVREMPNATKVTDPLGTHSHTDRVKNTMAMLAFFEPFIEAHLRGNGKF